MKPFTQTWRRLLAQVAGRRISVDAALTRLEALPYEDLGFAKADHHRPLRQGFPEVILGQGKTPRQIAILARRLHLRSGLVLITRLDPKARAALRALRLPVRFLPEARCAVVGRRVPSGRGLVAVVTAGTADIPVAEEAAVTAGLLGARVEKIYDAGVAGLHRLLAHHRRLREANCIVVIAGLEGALPSVVGGLVSCPVIAVPTSVGYGAAFSGLAPLLAMLNSCAPNVTVVNIDNGFSAGFCAGLINRQGAA